LIEICGTSRINRNQFIRKSLAASKSKRGGSGWEDMTLNKIKKLTKSEN